MSPSLTVVALGVFAVAMVTSAPLAENKESLVNLEQADVPVDRAKRMDEKIFYGNMQNKARTVEKKSGPVIFGPVEPQGEVDQGSKVIVHEEQPMSDEVKARLDAAEDNTAQQEQYSEELESNMHSIVDSVMNEKPEDTQEETETNNSEVPATESENESAQTSAESNIPAESQAEVASEGDSGSSSSSSEASAEEEKEEEGQTEESQAIPVIPVVESEIDGNTNEEVEGDEQTEEENSSETDLTDVVEDNSEADDAEKELQEMTSVADPEEASASETADDSTQNSAEEEESEGQVPAASLGFGEYSEPSNLFYDYLKMYQPYSQQAAPGYPYYLTRRRRRAPGFLTKARRNRRIKRDLLEDRLNNYYAASARNGPSSSSYYPPALAVDNNFVSSSDDYVPLTDDEAAVLYSRLLDYLEEALTEEAEEAESEYEAASREDEEPQALPFEPEFLPEDDEEEEEEEDEEDSPYLAESDYIPEMLGSPYEDGYPYGPVDLDTYSQYSPSKRDPYSYWEAPERKRSFFPYNYEPETHWGAFVPEKRGDYNEAIQRLQRLAMALSDNSAPYYREIIDDYKKK